MIDLLFNGQVIQFLLVFLALIISITIHEFAHAFTADRLGDPTPRLRNRLSLNPKSHLDPLGTLMLILFGFGWGKPVIYDPYNLKNPRKDAALISLSGPLSNLVLAISLGLAVKFITLPFLLSVVLVQIIYLNLILAFFNLVPIHPLDGGKILVGFLPKDLAYEYNLLLNRYGLIILMLLVLPLSGSPPISQLIIPPVNFILNLLLP